MSDAEAKSSGLVCAVCDQPCTTALVYVGAYCSDDCKMILADRDKQQKDALLAEPIEQIPAELDLPAFERYALKVAMHMLKTLPLKTHKEWQRKNPMLLVPGELADEIKSKALPHIPPEYVAIHAARGHARTFMDGTYEVLKNIPSAVVLEAMVKGHVFLRPPAKGDL